MKKTLLATIVSAAFLSAASATALSEPFGVHLVTTAGAPGSKMWRLASADGAVEEIALDSAELLDGTAIAGADAQLGPGGGGEIRLVLTAEGARKLSEVTSRNVGRRLGILIGGQLRAAPVVVAGITNGTLVVGGLTPGEADALAMKLGPPTPPAYGGSGVLPDRAGTDVVLRLLEGTWSLRSATLNGQPVPDRKFASGTWTFSRDTLSATNGEGEGARFTLAVDPAAPDGFRVEAVPPSKERGGWMIFRRGGDRLTIAFFEGFSGRPDNFVPAPKKVVLEFSPKGAR